MKAFVYSFGVSILLLIVLISALAMSTPASAAQQCAPLASVVQQLADKWQEVPRGPGLAAGGGYVVTLFHDGPGDTWTIVGVAASGTACILASGTGWELVAPKPLGTEG